MPVVSSSRVKNTGRGEITYSDQDSTNSALVAGSPDTSEITVVSSVQGDNIGDGVGIFAGSNGAENIVLEFKSLVAGPNVTLEEDGDTITISATGNATGGGGNAASDGFHLVLGSASQGDGSWANGAVPLTDSTSVSNAIDSINELLGLLVPSQPTSFPGGSLSIINTAGNTPMLAAGVTDNASSGLSAGTAVTRITTTTVSTNTFNDVGPGESGTLQLYVNNTVVGVRSLTGSGDNGTYGGLVISDQKAYPPATPGFWKSIDVGVTGAAVNTGINKIKIVHTGAGTTNEPVFVRDDMTSTPTISAGSVAQSAAGTLAYSSGVPHYGSGASLLVGLSFTNLAGETYYGANDPISISGSNSIITTQTYTYVQCGLNPPFARQSVTAQPIAPVIVNIDGTNVHGVGKISAVARNVNGASGSTQLAATDILVKRGTTTGIDELSIPVSGLGVIPNNNNATRVNIAANGDRPNGAATSWDSTANIATFEAAVVGGVLSHNQVNYLTGFLPIGPNLSSGRSGAQYITLSFQRSAVSNFKINVTGTYAGVWIKLPGVSDDNSISPNATNGWWDATVAYSGAGVPGNLSDGTAGCAAGAPMLGTSGSYTITFGPETSTNATGNTILVRIRLNAGQSITALSFSN
jgi:hypothetical protein